MARLLSRAVLRNERYTAEFADMLVFASTTCFCAMGALMLPLVG